MRKIGNVAAYKPFIIRTLYGNIRKLYKIPTESRNEANRATFGCAIFLICEASKARFRKRSCIKKTDSAQAECRFASVLMMARGGREKASQRLNPSRKT